MKNNYGKLTKKKAIELLYKYDSELGFSHHKILNVEILRSKNKTDCALLYVRLYEDIYEYFISSFGISKTILNEGETNIITRINVFFESEEKTNE